LSEVKRIEIRVNGSEELFAVLVKDGGFWYSLDFGEGTPEEIEQAERDQLYDSLTPGRSRVVTDQIQDATRTFVQGVLEPYL
jgi:hypothetical protein